MNVFYPKSTTGLKEIPLFTSGDGGTQNVYFTDSHLYCICSEGTLYQSPRFLDGSFDNDVWEEVDYDELNQLESIQDTLVEQAQKEGWYYTQAT